MFKVLALNCLVSAYMMSALYLRGLKQGDMQMTSSGLITAGLFFFLSQVCNLTSIVVINLLLQFLFDCFMTSSLCAVLSTLIDTYSILMPTLAYYSMLCPREDVVGMA